MLSWKTVRLVSNSLDIAQSAVGCCAFQEYAELLVGSVLVQGWCRLVSVCMTAYTTTAFTTMRHWAANLRTTCHACCSSACEALEQSCRMEHRRCISSLAGFQAANDLGHPAAGARPITALPWNWQPPGMSFGLELCLHTRSRRLKLSLASDHRCSFVACK